LESGAGGSRDRGSGRGVVLLWLATVMLVAAGGAFLVLRRLPPAPAAGTRPLARAAPTRPAAVAAPAKAARTGVLEVSAPGDAAVFVDGRRRGTGPLNVDLDGGAHFVRVEKPGLETYEREVHVVPGHTLRLEARLEPPAPRLRVEADVPGAQVFLDRRFVGQAPVVLPDVAPGPHRLNVSAEGFEMHEETVDVTPGTRVVRVLFKEVRLDERLAVIHRHGLGSCKGVLVATTAGLRYEAGEPKDAFALPFSALEPLEVDYLRRNLRVKQRGGRTFNFTADDADALLTFQKTVEAARARLR
jgi:PEGA domain